MSLEKTVRTPQEELDFQQKLAQEREKFFRTEKKEKFVPGLSGKSIELFEKKDPEGLKKFLNRLPKTDIGQVTTVPEHRRFNGW